MIYSFLAGVAFTLLIFYLRSLVVRPKGRMVRVSGGEPREQKVAVFKL